MFLITNKGSFDIARVYLDIIDDKTPFEYQKLKPRSKKRSEGTSKQKPIISKKIVDERETFKCCITGEADVKMKEKLEKIPKNLFMENINK